MRAMRRPYLARRHTLRRVDAEQSRDEVLGLVALVGPAGAVEVEDSMADVVEHALVVVLRKGVVAAESAGERRPMPTGCTR